MSIPHRLILLVVLAVLPVVGYEIIGAIAMRRDGERAIRSEAQQLLSLIRGEQARLIDGIRQTLITLGETEPLAGDQCQTVMDRLHRRLPNQIAIFASTADGIVRCGTEGASVGIAIGDQEHVRAALAGEPFTVGAYIRSRSDGRTPGLPFGIPVRDAAGRISGALTAVLELDWLTQYLAEKPLPPTATLVVADRHGVILARRPALPSIIGEPLPDSYRSLVAMRQEGLAERVGPDHRLRVVAYSPPDSAALPGLFVSIEIDKEIALAWIDRDFGRKLGILALLLLVGVGGAWWAGQILVRVPVAILATASEQWRAGDFAARAHLPEDGSELAGLAGSFNAMAATLGEFDRARTERLVLLHAVIRGMPSGLLVSAWPSGRLVLENAEAERLLGGAPGQTVGAAEPFAGFPAEHGDGRSYEPAENPTVRTARTGVVIRNEEMICRRPDGSRTVLAVSSAPLLDRQGRVKQVLTTVQDITARQALEQELRQAKERAEQASRSKSRFLAAASHDLRQPLQSLLLVAELLSDHVCSDKGRQTLAIVLQGLDTLRTLLDSLLDISRLDAGTLSMEIRTFALADLFDQLADAYRPLAARKGLSFAVVECRDQMIRSDPTLLGRIIRNLLDNAFRYTAHGEVRVDCRDHGDEVVIDVRDTGRGIPADQLDRIFEEFHRGAAAAEDGEPGLGLGLSIVQRLAALLGHRVAVTSQEGIGSSFRVFIARAPASQCQTGAGCDPADRMAAE